MKKVLKLVCLTLVFSMLFSLTAFAAEITVSTPDVDVDAKTAVVEGTVTDSDENQQVVILVLANGAKLGDASISDDDIAYIDQVAAEGTGDEKSFSFSFGINTDKFSGTSYTAYIGGTDVAAAQPKNLRFATGGPGDCDGSGKVDFDDYMLILNNYNKTSESPDYDERADLDGTGKVDFDDYMEVLNNYNKEY